MVASDAFDVDLLGIDSNRVKGRENASNERRSIDIWMGSDHVVLHEITVRWSRAVVPRRAASGRPRHHDLRRDVGA